MDQMDIDHTVEVPDTPDRLSSRINNERRRMKEENHSSSLHCRSGEQILCEEGTKDHPMLIDSGRKRLSLRHAKSSDSSGSYLRRDSSAPFGAPSSSSSRSPLLIRRGVTEKNRGHQMDRPPCSSRSSASQSDDVVDLTQKHLWGPAFGNSSPCGVIGSSQAEFRKRSGIFNGSSSSHGLTKISDVSDGATRGKDRVIPNDDNGNRVEFNGNIQSKHGTHEVLSVDSRISSRVNKQKRLVRNGCISPNNIAKAKQLAEKDIKSSAAVAQNSSNSVASSYPDMPIDINELVAEENNSRKGKGKGVISHPCTSVELDSNHKNLYSRNSSNFSEKAIETSDYLGTVGKSVEESGGWRRTHNQTAKLSFPSHEEQLVIREMGAAPKPSSIHNENRIAGCVEGNHIENGHGHPRDLNFISSENVRSQSIRQPIQHARARLGRVNGHGSSANTLLKRQRQRSSSNNIGECSTLASDDPEVLFVSRSSDRANTTSTSTNVNNAQPVIDVDELSPELRRKALDEEARARQLEADELLARALQEEFYNETPILPAEEVDASIALALRHHDEADYGPSRAMQPERNTRGSLISELRRQSRPSSNLAHRGAVSRASTLGRMTRLRNRFPGHPRRLLPSRGRASLFPANMDVEMRMHILGAMEAFNDMGVDAGILQTQRDFNENDYEMLLALDENNDRHSGASVHQINGLPQSTVQSDNYETCAVCLETPVIGDTIRHLPCLHKFHKDCIDPWLRRKTSCPVCKSSIT